LISFFQDSTWDRRPWHQRSSSRISRPEYIQPASLCSRDHLVCSGKNRWPREDRESFTIWWRVGI